MKILFLTITLILSYGLIPEYSKNSSYFHFDGNKRALELQLVNDSVFVQYQMNQTLSDKEGDVLIGKYEIIDDTLFLSERCWIQKYYPDSVCTDKRKIIECYQYSKRTLTKSCFNRYDSLFINRPDYEILVLKKGKSKKLREWQDQNSVRWTASYQEEEFQGKIKNYPQLK